MVKAEEFRVYSIGILMIGIAAFLLMVGISLTSYTDKVKPVGCAMPNVSIWVGNEYKVCQMEVINNRTICKIYEKVNLTSTRDFTLPAITLLVDGEWRECTLVNEGKFTVCKILDRAMLKYADLNNTYHAED